MTDPRRATAPIVGTTEAADKTAVAAGDDIVRRRSTAPDWGAVLECVMSCTGRIDCPWRCERIGSER